MKNDLLPKQSEFLLYTTPEGDIRLDVFFNEETVWLTQKKIAELFGVGVNTVNYHLKEIYKSKELDKTSTIRIFRIVQKEGKRDVSRNVEFYNLDAIISVGYRVNSVKATQFRIWATRTLKEYIVKGFVLDNERLKNGRHFGKDYFEELLEKIREIRASERKFYQKITDIYAQCSADYDSKAAVTKTFYANVQNKLHYAIIGKTAAEIIKERANADKPNMGLNTWKNAPKGKILKSDATIAKNYLSKEEIEELNLIVNMYLDYAELQVKKQRVMKMEEWAKRLDSFLQFNDYEVLTDLGKVSKKVADSLAMEEHAKFRVKQDKSFESDFDREVKKIFNTPK